MNRFDRFVSGHPRYAGTAVFDELRRTEFARLDAQQQIYLDYTGGALYAACQLREHLELLQTHVFGNPHSASPCSMAMTDLVEQTRRDILRYFNAPAGEYTVVFTPNATGALKLAGEAYPFERDSRLLLTTDNHNSVNGIREFATARGATVEYAAIAFPELRIDRTKLTEILTAADPHRSNLFAFPAQSNFSGVKHPLALIDQAHAAGWDVLLDAAAFVPTNRLDLAVVHPDFVAISFYKMFGYPTGVGCLIVRDRVLPKLRRPWFAGGTVNFATVQGRMHVLARGEAGFEDGTLNYLAIPAVRSGLQLLQRLGMDTLQDRVYALTDWLLSGLFDMRHGNGRPMVRIYGPATMQMRGPTVTMNFYDPDGHLLDYRRVEELAVARGISFRTGCFCNPGAGETAEGLTIEDMMAGAELGHDASLPRFFQMIQHRSGKSAGAIRVSLGLASNFEDIEAFLEFASQFRDQSQLAVGTVSFDILTCRVMRDGA